MNEHIDELDGWSILTNKRCENCGWWAIWHIDTHCCNRVRDDDSKAIILWSAGNELLTDPDFYCNEWKAKG